MKTSASENNLISVVSYLLYQFYNLQLKYFFFRLNAFSFHKSIRSQVVHIVY